MNILVSACLLGNPCRYDGKQKQNEAVLELRKSHRLIPVCPEVAGGLTVPRKPCEIVDDRVKTKEGIDCTGEYQKGASAALRLYKKFDCKCAILKHKSPSCSPLCVYDGSFSGTLDENKSGITATLLMQNNILVLSENELYKIPKEEK